MKKILALMLVFVLCAAFVACTNEAPVETTTTPVTDAPADDMNQPAAPGEGPDMPAVMPEVSDTDLPADLPSTDTDVPDTIKIKKGTQSQVIVPVLPADCSDNVTVTTSDNLQIGWPLVIEAIESGSGTVTFTAGSVTKTITVEVTG